MAGRTACSNAKTKNPATAVLPNIFIKSAFYFSSAALLNRDHQALAGVIH
jgi:hypothetical protein